MMTSKEMKNILQELYLKDRTYVSDDYDYCLNYLKEYLDFNIIKVPSGRSYWHWIIPEKYTVKDAYIQDQDTGEVIIDAKNHPLHLGSYSQAFEGVLDYNELKEHLYWKKDVPEGIPYYFKFMYRPWEKGWKFCMSYDHFQKLNKDHKYYVKIETFFDKGELKIAEYFKQGESDDTVLLVSHLDHPGQVNDGLSGTVVELAAMLELLRKETYYSYSLLIVQEYIGSVAYLNQCKNITNIKMGIFSEMLTTGLELQLKKSFSGNTYIDRVGEIVFKDYLEENEIVNYFDGPGNDELVFESPGVEIPFVSIMRGESDGKVYRQYHTHLDNMDLVNERELEESLNIINRVISVLEDDCFVKRTFDGFICYSHPDLNLYIEKNNYHLCGIQASDENLIFLLNC
jgi:aminopeptidase-like protein